MWETLKEIFQFAFARKRYWLLPLLLVLLLVGVLVVIVGSSPLGLLIYPLF